MSQIPPPLVRMDTLLTYPTPFPIKVMGAKSDALVAAVAALAQQFDPSFDRASIRMRASRTGRYLGACRTLGVDSENAPQRDQFLPDSPPHSGAMGQEDGKKWAAAAHSQPTIPKSDRLLGITLTITATSRTQLDGLYRALTSHPLVQVVL